MVAMAQLTSCLTSACQRDRPQSVNVFRHNLNEHLGPDTNLENYWIYTPDTSRNTNSPPNVVTVSRKADGDDGSQD